MLDGHSRLRKWGLDQAPKAVGYVASPAAAFPRARGTPPAPRNRPGARDPPASPRPTRGEDLSPSRYHASWRRPAAACQLDDRSSCPRSSPQRLTAKEIRRLREMVTSPDYRHMPTGTLARVAQRAGLPHSAFAGRTHDETYFGIGGDVPARLAEARKAARDRRIERTVPSPPTCAPAAGTEA